MAKKKIEIEVNTIDSITEAKNQEEFNLYIKNNVGECSDEVLVLFYSIIKKTDLA